MDPYDNNKKNRHDGSNYRRSKPGQRKPAVTAPARQGPAVVERPVENLPARNGRNLVPDRCPHCGEEGKVMKDPVNWYFVECQTCHACGAMRPHAESAVAAWNERFPLARAG